MPSKIVKDYEPTAYPWCFIVYVVSFFFIFLAFVTPYWLANDYEIENHPFLNTGLWQICFNKYEDYKYLYDRVYDGCYWTLDEEMHVRDDQLYVPFFVTVQVFFTFCFTLTLVGFVLVGILVLCPEGFEAIVLKLAYIDCFVAWFFGFIAVIVFGAMGDNRDWMPHWEHNNLSWSFALAVIGVVAQFIAGVLFWVESRILKRKEQYRQSHGVFTLETKA